MNYYMIGAENAYNKDPRMTLARALNDSFNQEEDEFLFHMNSGVET